MKIGLYNEPDGEAIGGCEYLVAVIAEGLQHDYQVEIVHRKSNLSAKRLGEFSGTDLSRVSMRQVPRLASPTYATSNPLARFRLAKAWYSELSKPYDFFVAFVFGKIPFCHASGGLTVVTFPCVTPEAYQAKPWSLKECLRRLYYWIEWQARSRTYSQHTTISRFSRDWIRRRWGVDTEVVYPPAQLSQNPSTQKCESILSVGRFTTIGTSKHQLEMVKVFSELKDAMPTWSYTTVGATSQVPEDLLYFERVKSFAADRQILVRSDIDRPSLENLYSDASIFWHAAGLNSDHEASPELAEHFGIVTVEAMSAGCVPVVINKGGQPEIVQHGENGFLWDTLEQLGEYTQLLVRNPALRARFAASAIARAQQFNKTDYARRYRELIVKNLPKGKGF